MSPENQMILEACRKAVAEAKAAVECARANLEMAYQNLEAAAADVEKVKAREANPAVLPSQ